MIDAVFTQPSTPTTPPSQTPTMAPTSAPSPEPSPALGPSSDLTLDPTQIPSQIAPALPAGEITSLTDWIQTTGSIISATAAVIQAVGSIFAVIAAATAIILTQRNFFRQIQQSIEDGDQRRSDAELQREQQRQYEREQAAQQRLHDLDDQRSDRLAIEERTRTQRELEILEKLFMSAIEVPGGTMDITTSQIAWMCLLHPAELPFWRESTRLAGHNLTEHIPDLLQQYGIPDRGSIYMRVRLAQRIELAEAIARRTGHDGTEARDNLMALYLGTPQRNN